MPEASKTVRKAFVLLSGGIDSTTCLHKAIVEYSPYPPNEADYYLAVPYKREGWRGKEFGWVEAVSINYGQRHSKEMEFAKKTCDNLGVKHTCLTINKDLLSGGDVMLTNPEIEIPSVSYDELPTGVSPTYVPFRNGTLLSIITAYAQKWVNAAKQETATFGDMDITFGGPREAGIYFGAHAEDAHNWAYPDCTPEFIGAMANAIYIGSYNAIRLHAPLQWAMKRDIVSMGQGLSVKWKLTWSCYKGDDLHCGVCPTCRARRQAFIGACVDDPTEYAASV